jgi:plasmid stabilization system protein ParE
VAEIVWSPQAISDVEAIKAYISRDSAHYARLVVDRLIAAVERAGEFPESGRIVPEIRALPFGRFSGAVIASCTASAGLRCRS